MDIVDLTGSPEPVQDKGKGKKRQQPDEPASKPKQRRTKAEQPESSSQQQGKKAKSPKAKPEKRTDAAGRTVRFAAAASQKVKERIARAMPGGSGFMCEMSCLFHTS